MDGTPRNGPPLPCTPDGPAGPLDRRGIPPGAGLGQPPRLLLHRGKLGSDPLYDGVLQHLPDDGQPVLDLGCGLGLFAHVLRQRGGTQPYLGVDVDAGKIARAQRAAAGLHAVRFDCLDVQAPLPAQAGHVLLLDVLQYLDAGPQQALLRAASARVAPAAACCCARRWPPAMAATAPRGWRTGWPGWSAGWARGRATTPTRRCCRRHWPRPDCR
jgi:SAM-dependent methyltransferase